jgi:class 3 adenylate cyclase/tetratricopeptide (TPR) repeat protein
MKNRNDIFFHSGEDIDTIVRSAQFHLDNGDPFFAYDITVRGLENFRGNIKLSQLAALALSRTGSLERAVSIIEPLIINGDKSEDSYGILASAYKKLWQRALKEEDACFYAKKALELYEQGFEITGGYYTGLNAATMHLFLGNNEKSEKIAIAVVSQCRKIVDLNPLDYWAMASLAEALLLTGECEEALEIYSHLKDFSHSNYTRICTTRNQALQIAKLKNCEKEISSVLDLGSVVIFTGHMIDSPDRYSKRFNGEDEVFVAAEIRKKLDSMKAVTGYSSAACGADILFLEAMLERGAEVNIVLPFRVEDFLETSVKFAGPSWEVRFNQVMERATTVTYSTNEHYLGDDILFSYCNNIVAGMGRLKSQLLGIDLKMLAVLEEVGTVKTGGTQEMLLHCRHICNGIEVIDLPSSKKKNINFINKKKSSMDSGGKIDQIETAFGKNSTFSLAQDEGFKLSSRQICTMIFADVVGFSKLHDKQAVTFLHFFQSSILKLMEKRVKKPAFCNTWGDGLFFVFTDLVDGADFALDLRDIMSSKNWKEQGFENFMDIRISLHTGPVFKIKDQLIGRDNYFGTQVARAARIEPITTPGRVYASFQTSALLALFSTGIYCEYVGNISLPKKYGLSAVYELRRSKTHTNL